MTTTILQLEAAFDAEFAKVGPTINAVLKYFKKPVEAAADEIMAEAVAAVAQVAPLVLSGQEKASVAEATVLSALVAKSKTAGAAIITAAVSLAASKLAALAPAPVSPPAQ